MVSVKNRICKPGSITGLGIIHLGTNVLGKGLKQAHLIVTIIWIKWQSRLEFLVSVRKHYNG